MISRKTKRSHSLARLFATSANALGPVKNKGRRSRRLRPLLLTGGLIVFVLAFLFLSLGRGQFSTVHKLGLELVGAAQSVTTMVGGYFRGVWSDYSELIDVRGENRRLREELAQYKAATTQYREAVATNVRLEKLLGLKEVLPDPTLTVRVVGFDPSPWYKTIIIDRGSSDGVQRGMPVVTVEGIVGQVIEASPHYAKVLLANDPNSAVDVVVQKNRVQGILKGDGERFVLHYVLRNADVEEGDEIITSGLGGVFPKGLSVGRVDKAVVSRSGMFKGIVVEPAANFSCLEYLIVILKKTSLAE